MLTSTLVCSFFPQVRESSRWMVLPEGEGTVPVPAVTSAQSSSSTAAAAARELACLYIKSSKSSRGKRQDSRRCQPLKLVSSRRAPPAPCGPPRTWPPPPPPAPPAWPAAPPAAPPGTRPQSPPLRGGGGRGGTRVRAGSTKRPRRFNRDGGPGGACRRLLSGAQHAQRGVK